MLETGIIRPSSSSFFFTSTTSEKEGWLMAFLCWLPSLKQSYSQRSISNSGDRLIVRWITWSIIFHQIGSQIRISLNSSTTWGHSQDGLSHLWWTLWIFGDAIWTHQCSSHIPIFDEWYFLTCTRHSGNFSEIMVLLQHHSHNSWKRMGSLGH